MELALYHGYVYNHMCEHRRNVLFSMREGTHNRLVPGATAINMLRSKYPGHANLFPDESHERGINRVLKEISRGRDVVSRERLVHWVQDINLCLERLSAILGISALRGSTGLRRMDLTVMESVLATIVKVALPIRWQLC